MSNKENKHTLLKVLGVTAVAGAYGVISKVSRGSMPRKILATTLDLPELKGVECWDGSDPVTRRSEEDRRVLRDKGHHDRY